MTRKPTAPPRGKMREWRITLICKKGERPSISKL